MLLLTPTTADDGADDAHANVDLDPDLDPDLDLDLTSARSPASSDDDAAAASSPATAATTPRARFPSDLKTLACTWPGCSKTFNRPARLRDHLNSHTNSRPFKCPYDGCAKDYIEDKHLKQHIKAWHTHERKYVCPRDGCDKSFVTGTRLRRHQAVHEGADRFRCADCGQSFRKKETLHKHIRRDHLNQPAFECPEPGCAAAFPSKPSLKRHRDKAHGEAKFWCAECPAPVGFTTESLLQQHIRHEHQGCIFCDYRPASRWELERHVEMRHSGKTLQDRRTHACTHAGCGKSFTKRSNLNAHVRTAHEGFRFVCGAVDLSGLLFDAWDPAQGCGAKFSAKSRLEDHVRFVHLGQQRPRLSGPVAATDPIDDIAGVAAAPGQAVACPGCDGLFRRYHDLDVHLARHPGHRRDGANDGDDDGDGDDGGDGDANADSAAPAPAPALPLPLPLSPDTPEPPQPPPFAQDCYVESAWPPDGPRDDDDLFAAQMDYGPPRDDWLDDEANILLLARDPPADANIDPALCAFGSGGAAL